MTEQKPQKAKKPKKAADPAKLSEQIENLQKEKDEIFAQLQRLSADYANFQKRAPKQVSDAISYEKEKIIKALLPAMDNFEHTLQNAPAAENTDVLIKGIKIIYDQMLDILKSHDVEQITALGEKFDPALHQAMMRKSDTDVEEDIVLEEFQKGYRLNGRVIRPSKVVVNKPEPQENEKIEQNQQTEESDKQDTQ